MPGRLPQGASPPEVSYDLYNVEEEFYTDEGTLPIPVGAASGPPIKVRMHAPIGYRVVRFCIIASGGLPVVPDPTPRAGETRVYKHVTPVHPTLLPQLNSFRFMVSGEYRFVQDVPSSPSTGYRTGVPPFVRSGDIVYDQSNFQKGIM